MQVCAARKIAGLSVAVVLSAGSMSCVVAPESSDEAVGEASEALIYSLDGYTPGLQPMSVDPARWCSKAQVPWGWATAKASNATVASFLENVVASSGAKLQCSPCQFKLLSSWVSTYCIDVVDRYQDGQTPLNNNYAFFMAIAPDQRNADGSPRSAAVKTWDDARANPTYTSQPVYARLKGYLDANKIYFGAAPYFLPAGSPKGPPAVGARDVTFNPFDPRCPGTCSKIIGP